MDVYKATLLACSLLLSFATSETQALGSARSEEDAVFLSNLAFYKQYARLETELLELLKEAERQQLAIGQLYTHLDMGDLYTFALIDYQRAIRHLQAAERLNEHIHEQSIQGEVARKKSKRTGSNRTQGNRSPMGEVRYFRSVGNHAVERQYDYESTRAEVRNAFARIDQILGVSEHVADGDDKVIEVEIDQSAAYPFAVRAGRGVYSGDRVAELEDSLREAATNHFKRRYRLTDAEKACLVQFNVLRGLSGLVDIREVPPAKLEEVLAAIEVLKTCDFGEHSAYTDAYIDYALILWNSSAGHYEVTLDHYSSFVDKVDRQLEALSQLAEKAAQQQDKALLKGLGYLSLTAASIALASGAGHSAYIDLSAPALNELVLSGGVQREQQLYDESNYSRRLNVFLNIDEQLLLLRSVGEAHHKLGQSTNSLPFHKEAVEIIASMRSTVPGEHRRIRFASYKDSIFHYLIDDLVRLGHYDEALEYAERARSRTLLDVLRSQDQVTFGSDDLTSFADALSDLLIAKEHTRRQIHISSDQVARLNERETALLEDYRARTGAGAEPANPAGTQHARLVGLLTAQTLTTGQILENLPPETALVEYYVSLSGVYAWVLEDQRSHFITIDISQSDLQAAIAEFKNDTKFGQADISTQEGKRLYRTLIEPVTKIVNARRMYIVSHGDLHRLPYEALHDGSEYLIEKYQVAHLPSASMLEYLPKRFDQPQSLLAFGNPVPTPGLGLSELPATETEVQAISELFARKSVHFGPEATEANLVQQVGKYDVLHIAAHGIFDSGDALNSRLFMSAGAGLDGELTAREIYGLSTAPELVVLSACETGISDIQVGDEQIGLTRSLFFAGASTIVASQWKVDDQATSELMQGFYVKLVSEGHPPMLALQLAKIELIQGGKYKSPFYWAPFSLYGIGL